jgi:predicted nucleic acid-binding protein
MARVIILDTGPFGLVAGPGRSPIASRCHLWVRSLLVAGVRVVVPEVVDYEVRRELLRRGATAGVARLDRALAAFDFAPITRDVMLRAAELWALARRGGFPGAGPDALHCDVIIAATAELAASSGDSVTVGTTNVGHLSRFVDAQVWDRIT